MGDIKTLAEVQRVPKYDASTHAATGFCKPSIILFDTRPGTRSFTIPQGVKRIRAFVVGAGGANAYQASSWTWAGAGGGYSEKEYTVSGGDVFNYTVGASPSGTSSFNSEISATGGETATSFARPMGGSGSGGDINTNGGMGGGKESDDSPANGAGGSSGNRFGNGLDGYGTGTSPTEPEILSANRGTGWSVSTLNTDFSPFDGFGIGDQNLLPAGSRAGAFQSGGLTPMGTGGGSSDVLAGIGGGCGTTGPQNGIKGGPGLVGIEVLEVE